MTDILPPLQQTHLFGHADLLASWQKAFENSKLHHGLLVTGPSGAGKATVAFNFLKTLFKQQSTQPAIVEKQMLAGSYPGLKIVERLFDEKRQRYAGEITLDAINPIFDFLRFSTIDGGYRAIVIDGADRMNRNAQNTILKLLEEPPKKTLFFLLAEQPGQLLPTIRSRCMRYNLAQLSPRDFSKGLMTLEPGIPQDAHAALYALSDGALGQAIHWHSQDWTALYTETVKAGLSLSQEQKPALKWAETYALAAQETAFDLLQDLLRKRFGQIVTARQTNQTIAPLIPAEMELINHWYTKDGKTLLDNYARTDSVLRAGERSHLDRKLTLLQALQAFVS